MPNNRSPPHAGGLAREFWILFFITGFLLILWVFLQLVVIMIGSSILIVVIGVPLQYVLKDAPERLAIFARRLWHHVLRVVHLLKSAIRQVKMPQLPRSPPDLIRTVLLTWIQGRLVIKSPSPSIYKSDWEDSQYDTSDFDEADLPTPRYPGQSFMNEGLNAEPLEHPMDDSCDCPCCRLEVTCHRCLYAREYPHVMPHFHHNLPEGDWLRIVHRNIMAGSPRPEFIDWFNTVIPFPEKSPYARRLLYDMICPQKIKAWPMKTAGRMARAAARAVPGAPVADVGHILSTVKHKYPRIVTRDMRDVEIEVNGESKVWEEWVEGNGMKKETGLPVAKKGLVGFLRNRRDVFMNKKT